MKLSVSLSEEDVAFVDEYAHRRGSASRSSVVHQAIEQLRLTEMEESYLHAWDEWNSRDDAALWDATAADGVSGAAR